jgi:transcription termination factor Rho
LQEEKVATKDATEEPAEPAPKKRGRKPKVEKETGTAFRIIRDIRPVAQILADIQNNIAAPAAQQDNRRPQRPTYNFGDKIIAEGVLELDQSHGRGFLRSSDYNYMPSPDDIVVTAQQIKNMGLKTGDVIRCSVNMPNPGEAYYNMGRIHSINGCDPRVIRDRSPFESLTPLFPDEKFNLCTGQNDPLSVRIVDLFAPIGKGQRALIVAQPKTGKTILMKEIANAIAKNHPEAYLMMLLVDERPEEVTDMSRSVKAEVVASTFDEPAERHVKVANMVLEKARRLVECGHDVVILLDSITRLARAYNTVQPASGKVLTGGVDANALQKPKRFFGAARNIEGGGSLTILATALTETGSKMDDVIFEEFKGTGNMELQLDRTLANRRIFPAVNVVLSSTRRDDLLYSRDVANRIWILRKLLADMNPTEAMNFMLQLMDEYKTNEMLLDNMNKVSPRDAKFYDSY